MMPNQTVAAVYDRRNVAREPTGSAFTAPLREAAVTIAATVLIALTAQSGTVITLDGTVGPAGMVQPVGSVYTIDASVGANPSGGNNLFHSFGQFDLSPGDTASFTGPANIHNILARVTGGSASTIDGTIDTTAMPNANFFFINPFGVIFGQHASVNVGGSFAVTTADYVKLADGRRFNAHIPANDVLTAAPVSAFGFLGPSAAPITFNGPTDPDNAFILAYLPDTKSIWLVGGDIHHQGSYLAAPGGEIVIVSVASAGELGVDVDNPRFNVDTAPFEALGTIRLNAATEYVDGTPGGQVIMEADRIDLLNSGISAGGSGDTTAGDVILRAHSEIELNRSTVGSLVSGDADSGDVVISAPTIRVIDTSVGASTLGNGHGGSIFIAATDFSMLDGGAVTVSANGPGGGGNLVLIADHVLIQGANGGSPALQAYASAGPPGSINLQADTVELLTGGSIVSDATGRGFAGSDVHITANSLVLDDQHGAGLTRITSRSADAGGGGGNIDLDVDHLQVLNGAQISTTTLNDAPAGNILVRGMDAIVTGRQSDGTGSAISSSAADAENTLSFGTAGSVTLELAGSLRLEDGGALNVSAIRNSGGDITVTAGDSIRLFDSQINAQAFLDGGNVHLTAPSLVYFLNSKITAQSVNGNGGNVTIDPQLVVLHNSQINTSAGINGGDITIVSDFVLSSPSLDQSLFFTGQRGINGTVTITSPDASLAGNFVGLPANPLDADSRLQPHCSVRLQRGISSFTTVGGGGTPTEPDGLLPALLLAPAK